MHAKDIIKNKYDFMLLLEVKNGNPNGDPDAGNSPRYDYETGLGLITDVCLKRKIRDFVEAIKEDEAGFRIYIKSGVPLNQSDAEAFDSVGIDISPEAVKQAREEDPALDEKIRDYMCANFFDIRTFGAVMTTFVKNKLNCGQVRGPVQLGFAESVEPITPQEITVTRQAITTKEDAEKKGTEMGRKHIVPYGLYRATGHVSADIAQKTTGFTEEDLQLLWRALTEMFEYDRSAARGEMTSRKLIVFKHDSIHGNAPAHKLFDLVKVERKDPESALPARKYSDYVVSIDESALPAGVSVQIFD